MYGLVNRAIEQLVISLKDEATWLRICARVGDSDEGFVALHAYPDDLTYRYVGAVSEELGLSPEQVLEAFGEYWILYTADEGYAELLTNTGDSLRSFLEHIDEMHSRVESVFPHMMLPWFSVTDVEVNRYHVSYGSKRQGLAPMVVGLLKGLGKRFGQAVRVTQIGFRANGEELDVFDVEVLAGE